MCMKEEVDFRLVGERVRIKRKEKGLSRKQAAKLAGMKLRYWSNIENNNIASVGLNALVLVANTLDTNIDYFLVDSLKENGVVTSKEIDNMLKIMTEKNRKMATDVIHSVYENSDAFGIVKEN